MALWKQKGFEEQQTESTSTRKKSIAIILVKDSAPKSEFCQTPINVFKGRFLLLSYVFQPKKAPNPRD